MKTIRINKKTNKLGKIFKIIKNSFFSKKEGNIENENEDDEDTNNEFRKKLIKKYDKLKKENKDEDKKLNYLKMNSFYQNENYNSINTNLFNVL